MLHQFCLFVLLFLLPGCLGQSANGDICQGQVGDYSYDLQGLSVATGGADQTCKDVGGNTYYYRPCKAISMLPCQTIDDTVPGVCQKDTRKVPQYHDLGSNNQVYWEARTSGADTGFFIHFAGGEEDRQSDIEFICDESAGVGQLQPASPTEQPAHFYHLQWRTAYACPTNSTNNGTLQCCTYASASNVKGSGYSYRGRRSFFSTCALTSHACPSPLGIYYIATNTTVTSCSECGSPQRNCCFYVDPNDLHNVNTQCTTNQDCSSSFSYNNINMKLVGSTEVDSCDDCYFA